VAASATAAPLLSGFGGPRDYGSEFLGRNDDGSSNSLPLPFTVNFFGESYTSFFLNNNGNITFSGPVGQYTPVAFPVAARPMIAPYWADVDTRAVPANGSNLAWVHSPNTNTVAVTWDSVGYYSQHLNKTNDFQLVLRNRADTGLGNFDVDFRYNRLQWTTGDASGGVNGLGGTPAQAGYDAGDGTNFLMLPGSRTAGVLQLQETSNVSADTPGLWTFAIRNGQLPGTDPSNPLMPVPTDAGWDFQFAITPNRMMFIDPLLVAGYEYIINSGPNIRSVLLPTVGDGVYDLGNPVGGDCVDSGVDLFGGVEHEFGAGGVNRFCVRGIELSAGLQADDPLAFVTGLTFVTGGVVDMSQNPLTVEVSAVPQPASMLLMGAGLGALALLRARRRVALAR
jgi:hypothetical protein